MAKTTEAADTAMLSDLERSNTTQPSTNYETFPPGTVLLEDPNAETKHGRDGHVVLQPTPSRDPNDPLNVSDPLGEYFCSFYRYSLFLLHFTTVRIVRTSVLWSSSNHILCWSAAKTLLDPVFLQGSIVSFADKIISGQVAENGSTTALSASTP